VKLVGLRLLGGQDCADVFQEIDTALLAGPSFRLFVAAGRTLEAQRGVTAGAESRDIANLCAALRALNHWARTRHVEICWGFGWLFGFRTAHQEILLERIREGVGHGQVCAHLVNTGRETSECPEKARRESPESGCSCGQAARGGESRPRLAE
jgi:hypothetical protein